MKQISFIWVFLIGIMSFTSCSNDETEINANVPSKVIQAFASHYPNIKDVQWDVVKNYHVARFNAPKTRSAAVAYNTNVWFTADGVLRQTDEDIDFGNLPEIVQSSFNAYKDKLYPEWTVDDCEILAREGMSPIFVIEIEDGDFEREISVSEGGDILKDVLDDDDEDEILPIIIPEEIYTALREIFPDSYSDLSILELEIDDDEIEIDVIENNRHKEIELDSFYKLVSIEYEITFEECQTLMPQDVLQKLVAMAAQAGIDIWDENVQKNLEIEIKETAKGVSFEIELEIDDTEFEVEIDHEGNIELK